MNKDDLTKIAEIFGEPLGQLAVAMIEIVETLKSQPGFDRLSFDRQIEERIQRLKVDSLAKTVLESILSEKTI